MYVNMGSKKIVGRVLHFFNTTNDDYFVVFTHNTTHALKIVAENFNFKKTEECGDVQEISTKLFEERSQFAYLHDSHHSVLGLRHIVRRKVRKLREN